ncbi:hypothetical protein AB1Y20_022763 [Prymnesium parvum]|uniref:Transmembrane 9 superfamily member n=1 Tax=Prymnesium parvum TaxID=97485 RepID=A0AB34JJR2_PRYPA
MLASFSPPSYTTGELIPMHSGPLTSVRSPLRYEASSIASCPPLPPPPGRLASLLSPPPAPYALRLHASLPLVACLARLGGGGAASLEARVRQGYRAQLSLGGLPAAARRGKSYALGYPLGGVGEAGEAYVNNHLEFVVQVHETAGGGASVVGFEVAAASVRYSHARWPSPEATNLRPEEVGLKAEGGALTLTPSLEAIPFTYNVTWLSSPLPYARRWEQYVSLPEGASIHYLSLSGSLATSLLLAAAVAAILVRTLRRDLSRYDADDEWADADGEAGWKYVHHDVLRPPPRPLLLASLLGAGVQLAAAAFATAGLALLSYRVHSLAPLLFAAAALPAGLAAAWLYRQMHGRQLYSLTAALAGTVPGLFLAFLFLLNTLLRAEGASPAVPSDSMLLLLSLWLCLDAPLVLLGVVLGSRAPRLADPVYTASIPRQVPYQPWYCRAWPSALLGGLLPFGCASIELAVLFSCVWNQRIYFLFGFLLLMMLTTTLVCAEVGIGSCYFQLCREDYRWWWRSFNSTGFAGAYLFIYALLYARSELQLPTFTACVLYYGYMAAAAIAFYLVTGTVGFLASFAFVQTIYSSLKVD